MAEWFISKKVKPTELTASKIRSLIKKYSFTYKQRVIDISIKNRSKISTKMKSILSVKKTRSNKSKKTAGCRKVLRLMDEDFSYSKALAKTLREDKRLSRKKLETELNKYI